MQYSHVLLFCLFPVATIFTAGLLVFVVKPKPRFVHVIQAFAAGVLLAGIATELMPRLNFHQHPALLTIAFFAGLALMLGLNKLNPGCCGGGNPHKPLAPFITAFALEFFINGILIALAGVVSLLAGMLVGISMAICCFVCGTAVAVRLHEKQYGARAHALVMLSLALLPIIGGVLSLLLLIHLPGTVISAILAFGVSVLLYIASADLLLSALKENGSFVKIAFFCGFIVIPLVAVVL